MKIENSKNADMWEQFRKAKGTQKKKEILEQIINPDETEEKNTPLTPNEAEIKKQQEKFNTQKIAAKVARGESVSDKDLRYLGKKDPDLLTRSRYMNIERKAIENQAKNAKTKKEAQNILSAAKQGAIYLAMVGSSKSNDGGSTGMVMISAIDKAEDNTRGELISKEKADNKLEIEKSQRRKKRINKLV